MGWRNDQCRKVCRIIDNFLANRPTERDSLIVAVRKAFDALEQPETNCSEIPNNSDAISRQLLGTNLAEVGTDCISRQRVIEPEAISKWKKEFREYVDSLDITRDDWKGIIEYIDEVPSVQPERKTGRWIPCPQNASWLYVYKCSECGGYLQISDVDGKGYKANYCSYCGAKMEGGAE